MEEFPPSQIPPDMVPSESQVRGVYTSLKGSINLEPKQAPFFLYVYTLQASTDELCIPRQDENAWGDAGIYQDMQEHTWKADNVIFRSAWEYLYTVASQCNSLLINKSSLTNNDIAELQTLRAYAYFRLMDLFGGVPLRTEADPNAVQFPAKTPRAELFRWIENQLTYICNTDGTPVLDVETGQPLLVEDYLANRTLYNYGTMTKGAYNVLKARLYLNSKVFLDLGDESAEYQAYLQKAIDASDAVIQSGDYSLETNVFANWFLNNGARNREIIFAIPYLGDGSGEGNELPITTLMPSLEKVFRGSQYGSATSFVQVNPGGTADDPNALINLFDAHDNRRLSILTGQLYDRDKYAKEGKFEKLSFGNWQQKDVNYPVVVSSQYALYLKGTINPVRAYSEAVPGRNAKKNLLRYVGERDLGARGMVPEYEIISQEEINAGAVADSYYYPLEQPVNVTLQSFFDNRGFDGVRSSLDKNSYKAFGGRIIKFELEENPTVWDSRVDMVIMRYAEVLYTKAEALIRLGRVGEAIPLFREVLANRGFDPMSSAGYNKDYPFRDMDADIFGNDKPSSDPDGLKISAVALQSKKWLTGRTTDISNTYLSSVSDWLEFMDQEWRREFAFEDRRRTDMIRFGKFTTTDWGMHKASNNSNLNVFPIPQTIIVTNPAVTQNPGY
jgi:hypothetical protein